MSEKTNTPNRLIKSTSPYLQQHAYNPVDWFEWGQEAFQKAQAEDKPILLSIGYSSCHWCHVMAHQSFEDNDIAQMMNEYFVCIKLDREERPDVDQIYMEAVQAMQQNGGWPLNVFLTPEQKPFFGGTYFPPKNWAQLLLQINKAFKEKRKEIEVSASDLSTHLALSDLDRFRNQPTDRAITQEMLDKMFGILESRIDFTYGGLDKAPKFIMPSIWLFLARYSHLSMNDRALEILQLTLNKIAAGGIYDQIRGGFARYSVDGEWLAPHFEKMLYDNGQLLSLYSEGYQLTKNETYKNIVYETVSWLTAEMSSPEGGFYSALDADSEGEEGKFYTWTYDELKKVLQNKTEEVANYYGATPEGNWEHGRNILKRESDRALDPEKIEFNTVLLAARNERIKPGLDDKILTGWNALTIQGLTDAYRAFGDTHFLQLAEKAMTFIENNLIHDNKIYRSFKGERSAVTGFLDDYAFLIQAYISLYQVTFNERYLHEASRWCTLSIDQFLDASEGYFFYNSNRAEALIARKKEIFDNVIPSSNAVMARNLYQVSTLLDKSEWQELSLNMISRLTHLVQSEPVYMCHWALFASEIAMGSTEIAIVGKNSEALRQELQQNYLPFTLVMGTVDKSNLPLLIDKEAGNEQTLLFACKNKTCKLPVRSVDQVLQEIAFNR